MRELDPDSALRKPGSWDQLADHHGEISDDGDDDAIAQQLGGSAWQTVIYEQPG